MLLCRSDNQWPSNQGSSPKHDSIGLVILMAAKFGGEAINKNQWFSGGSQRTAKSLNQGKCSDKVSNACGHTYLVRSISGIIFSTNLLSAPLGWKTWPSTGTTSQTNSVTRNDPAIANNTGLSLLCNVVAMLNSYDALKSITITLQISQKLYPLKSGTDYGGEV